MALEINKDLKLKVEITEENFPDKNFRNFFLKLDYAENGWLDLLNITSLKIVMYNSIHSLQGIEYFTELTELDLLATYLDVLDLSKNINLRKLKVVDSKIPTLDLSKNINLKELKFDGTYGLTRLNLKKNRERYTTCPHI